MDTPHKTRSPAHLPLYSSSVSGGFMNTASGTASSVSGGQDNRAVSWGCTAGGGQNNVAGVVDEPFLELYATVGGGLNVTASGLNDWAAGACFFCDF